MVELGLPHGKFVDYSLVESELGQELDLYEAHHPLGLVFLVLSKQIGPPPVVHPEVLLDFFHHSFFFFPYEIMSSNARREEEGMIHTSEVGLAFLPSL
jgi:hypothetical protein